MLSEYVKGKRKKMVDWMGIIAEELKMQTRTWFKGVNLMDLYVTMP